ncbi:MAG: exodeoxyribonuclease I [Saccharospirillum sp.]
MARPLSFLWYDYETWGTSPRSDRIAQFAAVRTDAELNPIGEPIDIQCKPAIDTLIHPEACLITGLTPQGCEQDGLTEWQFADRVFQAMSEAGTCTSGYNTLRFDDEFTRYLLYRNLHDPYSREWRNGNSRWDLLDVVRLTHALRPEGIEWPTNDQGVPSFRLEHLTAANGLEHNSAHDALSDVYATIALARLIKQKQPRLFDYALSLRFKHEVRSHLPLDQRQPYLHVSGMIPAERGCLTVEVPLLEHPDRGNEIIVMDLTEDPSWLLDHDADQLRTWLYTPTDQLPEGVRRPPFRTLHLNKSPMVAPFKMLTPDVAERFGIDPKAVVAHLAVINRWHDLVTLAREVFRSHDQPAPADPEQALYQGFIGDHDRALLNRMRHHKLPPDHWAGIANELHDERLPALVFNVRARHFPETLSAEEQSLWQQQVERALTDPEYGARDTLDEVRQRTRALLAEQPTSSVLQALLDWHQHQLDWLASPTSDSATPTVEASKATQEADDPDNSPDQLGLFDG